MLTVLAFVVALGLLVAIHEYGHYKIAVLCGIKVLKFSVGFGKPIYTWRLKGKPTEFSIGMLPLGGYVKMLDEREAPVDAAERHLAFNTQPLKSRAAVVSAGPIANLLLAIFLYSALNWTGMQEPKAVLSSPPAGSVAEKAGLRGMELVEEAGFEGEGLEPVRSFEDLRWRLMQGALHARNLRLSVTENSLDGTSTRAPKRDVLLVFQDFNSSEVDAQFFRNIGIVSPWSAPVIGAVVAGGPAAKAGLQAGDTVTRVGPTRILDGQQLRQVIRASGNNATAVQVWQIERGSRALDLQMTPRTVNEGKTLVAKIDASVGVPPKFVTVRYGVFEGLWQGVMRTWESSVLTVKMMGKMLIGQVSLKNLSGPLTIADYAGKSASIGWTAYLLFLAAISVSLGVLNLLPLPVLDGGHLMYYLWEAVTGRTVSDAWMEGLQRGGIAILLCMMSIALFNDVTRIFG